MRDALTKDDFYEIEKICDIYASWISENINKYCQTAMHYDAVMKDDNPINKSIMSLADARKRVSEIRTKLAKMRNIK